MATALKKPQETKELDAYLKKIGLNSTALSLVETLMRGSGNDNHKVNQAHSLDALNDFFAKKEVQKQAINKEFSNNSQDMNLEEKNSKEADLVEAFETVTQAIQTIRDQRLDQEEAQALLIQVEALTIIENDGTENLQSLALQQMRTEVQNEDNFARLHNLKRETDIRIEAMAFTHVASKVEVEPEAIVQPNPAQELAHDILAKDQEPKLEKAMQMQDTSEEQKTISELIQEGADFVVRDHIGNHHTIERGTDIKGIGEEQDTSDLANKLVESENDNRKKQLELFKGSKNILVREKHNHALKPLPVHSL